VQCNTLHSIAGGGYYVAVPAATIDGNRFVGNTAGALTSNKDVENPDACVVGSANVQITFPVSIRCLLYFNVTRTQFDDSFDPTFQP
jgi:hypothetical protein